MYRIEVNIYGRYKPLIFENVKSYSIDDNRLTIENKFGINLKRKKVFLIKANDKIVWSDEKGTKAYMNKIKTLPMAKIGSIPMKNPDIRRNKVSFEKFKKAWIKKEKKDLGVKTDEQLEAIFGKDDYKSFLNFVNGRRGDYSKIWGFYDDYRTSPMGLNRYLEDISE